MPYATEDEIDWSDGTLHTPAPAYHEPDTANMCPGPVPVDDRQHDSLFESDDEKLPSVQVDQLSHGLPADIAQSLEEIQQNNPSTIRCAETSVRDHYRVPSRDDYMDFVLYQANQKAYEATILKQFVAHALHPDQVGKCFGSEEATRIDITRYMASISKNVDKLANKMVWNAHHRVICMFANEGKESTSFLHVRNLENVFAGFGPITASRVAGKLSESWHRAMSEPPMIQLSTLEYPLRRHTHPLEDIDDLVKTSFNQSAPNAVLTRSPPMALTRKKKARNIPGITKREKQPSVSSNNHIDDPDIEESSISPCSLSGPEKTLTLMTTPIVNAQPSHFVEPNNAKLELEYNHNNSIAEDFTNPYGRNAVPTRLEMLFDHCGADALTGDCAVPCAGGHSDSGIMDVPSWPLKLLHDHKRRLTERWGNPTQALETLRSGSEQTLVQALAKGFCPTAPDWHERVQIIASEQTNSISDHIVPVMEHITAGARTSRSPRDKNGIDNIPLAPFHATAKLTEPNEASVPSNRPVMKRRKMDTKRVASRPLTKRSTVMARKLSRSGTKQPDSPVPVAHTPILPHPSGSKTLEPDQILPPGAYFEAKSPDEKPAWRCCIKHAMGHYYNAGDRKTCRGCNSTLMDIPKVTYMDFYMPRRQFFHQPATGMRWKPCKPPLGKGRKNDHSCHNSIAKYPFWAAIDAGATEDQARQIGRDAVIEYLRPKPRKEPTPKPEPEPEPGPPPHPSGSTTMELGQEFFECAYWKKKERHEEFAWRCDVSHGLGRYYLAGDKKSCPGCGTNKGGRGRQTVMDFFLPLGTILRQEAPGLVKWKPRQYKARAANNVRATKNIKTQPGSHNQVCSEKYFQAKAQGLEHEEALQLALEQTDAWLDGKQDELARQYEQQDDDEVSNSAEDTTPTASSSHSGNTSAKTNPVEDAESNACRRNAHGGCTVSLIPTKRTSDELSDEDMDGTDSLFGADGDDEGVFEQGMHNLPPYLELYANSSAEESSGSESE